MVDKTELRGTVIGVTKVKSADGMALKVTLDSGVYLEVVDIKDDKLFRKLSKLELEDTVRVTIEKG